MSRRRVRLHREAAKMFRRTPTAEDLRAYRAACAAHAKDRPSRQVRAATRATWWNTRAGGD